MRSEGSPLDLNNLPNEDFTRDGSKQVYDETSTSGQRRKKNSGKEESEKIYECRFCSLKFCKSQALGGHMNRHRQERETETLNKARQLVYSSENLAAHPLPHLGSCVAPGAVYPNNQVYPSRPLVCPAASTVLQPPPQLPQFHHHQSYMYTSTPPQLVPAGDYFLAHGHALTESSSPSHHLYNESGSNYTCIGEPVGVRLGPAGRDGLDEDDGLTTSWVRS